MTREELEQRIRHLEAEIQQILAEANRQVGFRQGQIALCREWLTAMTATGDEAPQQTSAGD